MDAPTLTSAEFRDFLGRSLNSFLDEWAAQESTDTDVFREAMTGHDWLKTFSEFAVAEIVNPPRREDGPPGRERIPSDGSRKAALVGHQT